MKETSFKKTNNSNLDNDFYSDNDFINFYVLIQYYINIIKILYTEEINIHEIYLKIISNKYKKQIEILNNEIIILKNKIKIYENKIKKTLNNINNIKLQNSHYIK